ncbi:MAG: hypothetical protein KC416_15355, partial [Myxococcales bacterium]|nr:hypothetical protein [Myxococcales bacterium]
MVLLGVVHGTWGGVVRAQEGAAYTVDARISDDAATVEGTVTVDVDSATDLRFWLYADRLRVAPAGMDY